MGSALDDIDEWFASLPLDTWWRKVRRFFRRFFRRFNLRELRREIRWGIQRWRRGYSDCDVWNTDDHLTRIIPPMMRQLSRELHGVPGGGFMEECGSMEAAMTEWRRILEAVAVGFEARHMISEEYPEGERLAELTAQWEEGSRLLIEHFGAFWD